MSYDFTPNAFCLYEVQWSDSQMTFRISIQETLKIGTLQFALENVEK